MRLLTSTSEPSDLAAWYGRDSDSYGVCADHEHLFTGRRGSLPSGARILVRADGTFERVVCGEIVRIYTEDGPGEGRCGLPCEGDDYACVAHRREEIEGDDGWEHLRQAWGPEGVAAELAAERD